MQHVDALSRAINILVVEDNPFETNLVLSQNRDPNIKQLREQLEKNEHHFYEMRNGLVYRKEGNSLLFCVPESMISHVIRKCHDEMGHLSVEKTCNEIKSCYWFSKMKERVQAYIRNCLKCIAFNPVTGETEALLHNLPKGNVPFSIVHIDHYGPINKKHLIKQHLLVVIDSFTKYVKLYPVKTTAAKEAITCMQQYFANFSRPKVIVLDRGSGFTAANFEEFLRENNV